MKKLRSPYFVKAEILKDGSVRLVDDDGETYHVELRPDQEWPLMSSPIRNRQMRAIGEKAWREEFFGKRPPRPSGPFTPKLVS